MKKLFFFLSAMLLSSGMWAESVTFATNREYKMISPPKWGSHEELEAFYQLRDDCAVQSNQDVKIDLKNTPLFRCEYLQYHLADYDYYNYYLWLQTDKVEVSRLNKHIEIESIKVTYVYSTKKLNENLFITSKDFSLPFPAGQTSNLFTFTQGGLDIISITVNYHSTIVDNVPYIDADGNAQTANNVTKITNTSSTLDAGWYVVNGADVQTAGLVCNGAVHLILADGATLTARGGYDEAGIRVSGAGNALTIYGQANQTGKLIAKGEMNCAGIGGNSGEDGSNITINGGDVTANGGFYAAGIGGGDSGSASNITINGGKIDATGVRSGAAGIGGGQSGSASNITINGGEVTATGASFAAGIGGGQSGSASNIRINGGTVIARGGTNNDGDEFYSAIGAGNDATANGIYVSTSCVLKADNNNPPTTVISHTTTQDIAASLAGKQYATIEPIAPMTVTLDMQGGNGGTASVTATYDAAMPAITLPTRTGYTFLGYFTETNGAGTKYYNADGSSAHVWDLMEDKTLYAYWTVNQYTVTLDLQGGEEGTTSVTATYDAAMPAITLPTRSGYAFGGYFSEAEGAGTQYYNADGTSVHVWDQPENKTLYAHWIAYIPYIDADGTTKYVSPDDVTEITNASSTLNAGWYVVLGEDVQTGPLFCRGEVHLILADGAKLTAKEEYYIKNPGIQVTGGDNSLTIYGQTTQSGQLIAQGGQLSAAIGGAYWETGANIRINGGIVMASGAYEAPAIGCGYNAEVAASDIYVNPSLLLYVGNNNPPTTLMAHAADEDLSESLADKQYVIIRKATTGVIVTLDQQGGIGGDEQVIANEAEEMPTLSSLPTRDNFVFDGYYSAPNGQGTRYYYADGSSAHKWDQFEAKTLYAKWLIPDVPYVDADGTPHTANAARIINTIATLDAGWYVVLDEDLATAGLICDGAVNLILADGAKLTATAAEGQAGIQVSATGASLTIYAQTAGSGQLIANAGWRFAAGIGGASDQGGHDITINGGIITATGGDYGAGIGGELGSGQNITINGGDVTANGGFYAAGIGGGYSAKGANLRINGGTVTATGGEKAPAIGSGYQGETASDVYVNPSLLLYADSNNPPTTVIPHTADGDVAESLAGKQNAIIRKATTGLTVTLDKQGGTGGDDQVNVNEGVAMPNINIPTRSGYAFGGYFAEIGGAGTKYYNADGTSANEWAHAENGTLYAQWKPLRVDYIDADGSAKFVTDFTVVTHTTTTLESGWYVVLGEDVETAGLICTGEVHLILVDGAKLTTIGGEYEAGIRVTDEEASLTIYGQTAHSGQLIAQGGGLSAGIGGFNNASTWFEQKPGHNITINGGTVTATGGASGAGIGGGIMGAGINIIINGGKVTAIGAGGAGIGSGYFGKTSSNIYVKTSLILKAGDTENPTTIITNDGTDLASILADKQYATIEPGVVVTTRYAANMQANYGTYYNSAYAYEVVTEGVTLYTASLETYGSETFLNLHEINGNILPAGTPVIIRSESETAVLLAVYTGSTTDVAVPANSLSGTDVDLTVAVNTVYTLAAEMVEEVETLAFYKFSGTTIPAHKAYLNLPAGTPAPHRIGFGSHISTNIENVNDNANVNKLLRNGQLYIERAGRTYNAQGMLMY